VEPNQDELSPKTSEIKKPESKTSEYLQAYKTLNGRIHDLKKQHHLRNQPGSPQGKLHVISSSTKNMDKDGEIIELRLRLSEAQQTISQLRREKKSKEPKKEYEKALGKLKTQLAFQENEIRALQEGHQEKSSPPNKKQKKGK